ncbi:hypothetical protein QQX98_004680 [Neonectria punicea]|uniref:HNH nuclease domain-containing protein n=1 Tax=Neonectria punicea TaxID=979145 RepID=A0ABR1H7Z6_9HYPO
MGLTYRLIDYHIISASVYDETTGTHRESTLDLDYCIQRNPESHTYWIAARAPKHVTDPELDHTTAIRWRLSDAFAEKNMTITLNGSNLHIRTETYIILFPNKISDSDINLDNYIRCTKTGRLEWMHPPYEAFIPEWLETVLGAASAMSKVPSSGFETAIDLAKDHLTSSLNPGVHGAHKKWMEGTYVDNGQLIRHGS